MMKTMMDLLTVRKLNLNHELVIAYDGAVLGRTADTIVLEARFGRETMDWKELRLSEPSFNSNPFAASVGGVALRDGTLRFTDQSVVPPVRMALTRLGINIGAFSSTDRRLASVAVRGTVDNVSPFQISGQTNPLGAPGTTTVRGMLQNVNLLPLSPYAAKYLAYELSEGELSLDINWLLRGRKLSAQTTLAIDHLNFGAKTESRDAARLPLRMAVALLKDSSGMITLHVPIEATLGDPAFALGAAILEGLLTPFVTAAEFPFAALGARLGGGGEELGFQEFSSGSAELLPRETGKLDTVLRGLERWPELMLDIEGSVDVENDDGGLQLLAANRARSVKEYLLRQGTIEPDRIFLVDNSLENVPRNGSRALLSLKERIRGTQ